MRYVAIQLCHPLTMATHKPLCEKWTILSLPLRGKVEEIASDLAAATGGSALAWPGCAICDVDVVVAGDLIARRNLASRHEEANVAFVQQPRIRVAAVVHVAVGNTPKDYPAVGIRTVLDAFAQFLPYRGLRRYLSNNIDTPDPLAGMK